MKKLKYLLWLVVIGLVALVLYQNKEFFTMQRSFGIDLYFFKYDSPEMPTGVYYLAVFLIGLLISYFFTLRQKFRSRKTIRQLNEKVAADEKKIANLQAGHTTEAAAGPAAARSGEKGAGQAPGADQGVQDTEAVEQKGETKDIKSGE
ncbi:MAG: LapA family protein [Thermodesulfobacteriota bacterium]